MRSLKGLTVARASKAQVQRIVFLCYCMVFAHPGYSQLYTPLLTFLQSLGNYVQPTDEDIRSRLEAASWLLFPSIEASREVLPTGMRTLLLIIFHSCHVQVHSIWRARAPCTLDWAKRYDSLGRTVLAYLSAQSRGLRIRGYVGFSGAPSSFSRR